MTANSLLTCPERSGAQSKPEILPEFKVDISSIVLMLQSAGLWFLMVQLSLGKHMMQVAKKT